MAYKKRKKQKGEDIIIQGSVLIGSLIYFETRNLKISMLVIITIITASLYIYIYISIR